MLLAIYSIMWEQRALADRDLLYEPEWARLASTVRSAIEPRQLKGEPQPEKSTIKRLESILGYTQRQWAA
jgi:hypothetical protein